LDQRDAHEVDLAAELEFTRLYLSIQAIRFGERLAVEYDIAPETAAALVPAMILQPLVENAIRHGVEQRNSPGTLRIASRRLAERLELVVQDDGPGLGAESDREERSGEGIGLANIRARLEKLYRSDHALTVGNRSSGGLQVKIEIPWREEPVA
jgi:two-component system sensor histidine kinase AlgZ